LFRFFRSFDEIKRTNETNGMNGLGCRVGIIEVHISRDRSLKEKRGVMKSPDPAHAERDFNISIAESTGTTTGNRDHRLCGRGQRPGLRGLEDGDDL
jgi:hypothetical protein